MKLDTFINRPVLSTVISIFIVLLGLIGLSSLPITQYPDIAPPTISVSTSYNGANAQAVLNSVIAPLEESINGAEGMTYIESTATNTGEATINVHFEQGFDPDMAAVDVQNRVAKAPNLLPSEVNQVGVLTQKRQTSMLVGVSLVDTTNTYTSEFLDNYMKINVIPVLQRVKGVGDVMSFGGDYSMRIWIKPEIMAQYGLTPADVAAALRDQNIEAAPGSFGAQGEQSFQYTMKYRGRYETPEEFENIVVRTNANGDVLYLKDVADVELGKVTYDYTSSLNGKPATMAIVFQTAGSNATEIINECLAQVEIMKKDLPKGLEFAVPMNNNDFLYASIHKVISTLIEAFILVFFVVYVFLSDLRSTIIPAIAIPVALVGTFFAMQLIGFSINLITLSALVLAIAIVVDDAIVVVEAVHAKLDAGYKSARKASIDAMSEIGTAIISITLVMMLVFIPVSFMPGTSGIFYQQFGLTMAIAIGFSALNALTLSPALCAVFLKPHKADGSHDPLSKRMGDAYKAAGQAMIGKTVGRWESFWLPLGTLAMLTATITFMVMGWFDFPTVLQGIIALLCAVLTVWGLFTQSFKKAFERVFNSILGGYNKCTSFFIRHKITSAGIVAASIAILVWLMGTTPTALVPNEDTGTFFVMVDMPPGTSQERTIEVMNQVDHVLMNIPAVEYSQQIVGYSFIAGAGPTYGTFIVKLKDWSERDKKTESVDAVLGMVYGITGQIVKDGRVIAFAPPMITGYSTTNGFELKMQDKTGGDINQFFAVVQGFLAQLNQQPEIQMAYTTFNPTFPQYKIDIDAAKAQKAGLSTSTILSTLQGSMYVSNFNRFGKIYRVMMQAPPQARVSPETLKNIKVRSANGSMASLENFINIEKVYGPDLLNRFNLFQSIAVTGNPAEGYSSGQALAAIERVAAQTLPAGYGYEYAGMTREEGTSSSNTTAIIFGLCLLFVYLLLSAQYESYIIPWGVILSIPFGLMGSFIFAKIFGITNNIYLQISLIMLIGLLAKNAILIIEFALERRRTGMSIVNAAIAGATARLRPILMTSLALIIGLLPMMFASGVGANGNRALGVGSIGGMLIGMILQIFIVPALFVAFQIIQEKITPIKWKDTDNEGIESEIEQYSR